MFSTWRKPLNRHKKSVDVRLHSVTRVKLQVTARKSGTPPRYSSSPDKPVLQCKDAVWSRFSASVFSVTFLSCLTSNYVKPGQLFRRRYRYFLHTAIREFMRLLLAPLLLYSSPSPIHWEAGRQIKVGRFFRFPLSVLTHFFGAVVVLSF